MGGRIQRQEDAGDILAIPVIGKIKIGIKAKNQNGVEYPKAVDYFVPAGKYAAIFGRKLGDKPNVLQVIFPSDDPEKVCNERYEWRDKAGALAAEGDGKVFRVWDGKRYNRVEVTDSKAFTEELMKRYPTTRGFENWDIRLILRFIVPAVSEVVGLWEFSTKGKASSVKNIRESFDAVQMMRGTVTQTVFDLAVEFAKSNKPNDQSHYPVVSLTANDASVEKVKELMQQKKSVSLLIQK